jgi:hypothetical protein
MEDLKVYGNAVIDGTLLATGLITATAGIDIIGTLQFDGAGPAIDEVLDEDNLVSDSATKLATQQSIKAYVDTVAGGVAVAYDLLAGFTQRTKATWSDVDTITLEAARYHHNGTVEQIVKWDAALTFDFGSGGSNAASDDLTASAWHYLYIDDSALSGGTITAARLLNSTTAPTWNASELGWYNGNDKCIGAFLTNGSSQLLEFFQADDLIHYADAVSNRGLADLDTTWTDVTLSLPSFSTKALCTIVQYNTVALTACRTHWRTNGQTGTSGHVVNDTYTGVSARAYTQVTVVTDSGQTIEVKNHISGTQQVQVNTNGYYLPRGM